MYRMAKGRSPQTLEDVCIEQLACTVAAASPCQDSTVQDETLLAGRFVQPMLYEIDKRGQVDLHHLECLLRISQNIHLDLRCIRYLNHQKVVKLLTHYGKKINVLNLSFFALVSPTDLRDLVRASPNLTALYLRGTTVNDDVIKTLVSGTLSLTLEVLDIRFCPAITDMCVEYFNQLKNLNELDITENNLSIDSIRYLLLNLNNLEYFNSNNVVGAVLSLSPGGANGHMTTVAKRLKLRSINIQPTYKSSGHENRIIKYSTQDIKLLCSLCPFLQEVEVSLRALIDINSGLNCFKTLHHMNSLTIDAIGGESNYDTFEGAILPLLHERGGRIHDLTLRCISNIDRSAISKACPHLQRLNTFSANDYLAFLID